MNEIMRKARIKYSSLQMIDDIHVEPQQKTQSFFDKLISDFQMNSPEDSGTRVDRICVNLVPTVYMCVTSILILNY